MIHQLLAKAKDTGDLSHQVEAVRVMYADPKFAAFLQANPEKAPKQVKNARDLQAVTFLYLMMFLYARDYVSAAGLLWGPDTFTAEPQSVKLIWGAVTKHRLVNLLGAASSGKTYSPGARFILDWVLDPEHTLVRVMSTKEEHCRRNLFADMVRLFTNSVIPLPGKADSESIATPAGKLSGQGIFVLVIPRGMDAGGTIKGSKVKPRPNHPLFGTSSRTFLLIDEAQEVPENAFDEIPNLYSSMEEGDVEHTKIVMAANPKDIFSRYGRNCIPEQGWDGIQTRDSSVDEWESTTGWHCVRLNAMKSENVVQKKLVFPRFFTMEGYRLKLKDVGGDAEHPLIWSEVYGMFPPGGTLTDIIHKHWIDRSYREWIFQSVTQTAAGEDVAFTGDQPAMTCGRIGQAIGYHTYDGKRHDLPQPRWVVQADTTGILPRGDSQELADESMSRLKNLGVKPALFAIDRTGVGQGTHDIIKHQWRQKVDGRRDSTETVDILGIHYAESPTEQRICEEDTKSPRETYSSIIGELWYATAKFFEYDCIGIGKGVPHKVIEELVNRRGGSPAGKGKLLTVESKDDFKLRNGGKSPDMADSFVQFVHAARMNVAELKPRAPDTVVERPAIPSIFDRHKGQQGPGLKFASPMQMRGAWQGREKAIEVMKD